MYELVGKVIVIDDREIEKIARESYGIEGLNPSEHGLIGGDDSDGYVLVDATNSALDQYAYWQSEITELLSGGENSFCNLNGLIHRFVLDGHLNKAHYVVHGCWG